MCIVCQYQTVSGQVFVLSVSTSQSGQVCVLSVNIIQVQLNLLNQPPL